METFAQTRRFEAHRCALIHSLDDPWRVGADASFEHFEDGLLVVDEKGHVAALGRAADLLPTLPPETALLEHRDSLICPGFIDAHVHYPQTDVIASYGARLLDWLTEHTFPAEREFADPAHARAVAERFLTELLSNGTTTALVFCTVHPQSVDAFFAAAQARRLRMIAGKVLMDRNAPAYLRDTPQSGSDDSRALIERWHRNGRLSYAVTPRFALTSSAEQLARSGELLAERPGLHLHTHLAESDEEIAQVLRLFPDRRSYLDVYDHFNLLGERSVFAHGVHLQDADCERLAETGSALAFCPSSNLFLGSGLFDLAKMETHGINVGLGTDVGAGTSFSLLRTLNEAYKVQQLRQRSLSPLKSLYLATLGGARALRLQDRIGNFEIGKEADFLVLDCHATPLISHRMARAERIEERLFALMTLGDDRVIREAFIMGKSAFKR